MNEEMNNRVNSRARLIATKFTLFDHIDARATPRVNNRIDSRAFEPVRIRVANRVYVRIWVSVFDIINDI